MRRFLPFLLFAVVVAYMWRGNPPPTEYDLMQLKLLQQKADRPKQPLVVTFLENKEDTGHLTCTQKGKTLFFFDAKKKRGKIILNTKEYLLTKGVSVAKSSIYIFSGSGVYIATTLPDRGGNRGGNCNYMGFPYIEIALGADTTVLRDVEIKDCPYIIRGPGAS